jgi:hypothetical protein
VEIMEIIEKKERYYYIKITDDKQDSDSVCDFVAKDFYGCGGCGCCHCITDYKESYAINEIAKVIII